MSILPSTKTLSPALFDQLADRATATDQRAEWPGEQLQLLRQAGVMAWGIPEIYGGISVSAVEQTQFYLDCAASCLTTAFVLSQRNAAVSRLVSSENSALKEHWLPKLASGEIFTTVGISHLSTSRQHLREPAVRVQAVPEGYLLSGSVPWITGGQQADCLMTGGTLSNGEQILVLLDTHQPGLRWGNSARMLALNASATCDLQFENLQVPSSAVLAGPQEQVMKAGGGGTGSLTTSALALGVAGRAVRALAEEAQKRDHLQPEANQLYQEWEQIVADLLTAEASPEALQPLLTQTLRGRANSLVLRSSQALLTATKGAGFLAGHLAERTMRESLFFLVWSCPQPVAQAALKEFACTPNWL